MTAPLLETRGLTRLFGGLMAVDSVALEIRPHQTHAVIGPNGAGKSTLVNLLTGHLAPSGGQVLFKGRDVTGLPPHRLARLGIGRGYQKTNLFPTLSVFENVRLAAQARLGGRVRLLRPAASLRAVNDEAARVLALCGLEQAGGRRAGALSHGGQRQVELAMVLATGPEVLVLDEPLAGMGREESERMMALLCQVAATYTILLIEHDMDAVFSIAQTLTVMVNGAVLESGPVEAVRASPAVRDAYLGEGGA